MEATRLTTQALMAWGGTCGKTGRSRYSTRGLQNFRTGPMPCVVGWLEEPESRSIEPERDSPEH